MYSYRVHDVATFYARLSATTPRYTADDTGGQLRAGILTAIASGVGATDIPFLDMAGNWQMLSNRLHKAIDPVFLNYGLQLTGFFI